MTARLRNFLTLLYIFESRPFQTRVDGVKFARYNIFVNTNPARRTKGTLVYGARRHKLLLTFRQRMQLIKNFSLS